MAGHSKWSNIKRRKEAQDNKRGKIFTRLIREIMVAARQGADPESNAALRLALSKAQQANMNKDNMERAIARGSGQHGDAAMERIYYEGYGPGGIAYYVETLTDNRNRTVAEVRHAFSKSAGSMAAEGAVAYLFKQRGVIHVLAANEDVLLEKLLDHNIEDTEQSADGFVVLCAVPDYMAVVQAIEADDDISMQEHSLAWLSEPAMVSLSEKQQEQNDALYDRLDQLDDVQHIYSNRPTS